MGQYILGVDNGNTVSKAALFDLHGKEIANASCKVDTEYPHAGWTERSMETLWQGTACAIHELIDQIGYPIRGNCWCWVYRAWQWPLFAGQTRPAAAKRNPIDGYACC